MEPTTTPLESPTEMAERLTDEVHTFIDDIEASPSGYTVTEVTALHDTLLGLLMAVADARVLVACVESAVSAE